MAANSVENSQIFVSLADGTRIGQGMLPASIAEGVLFVHNGRPTTTLGAILASLGKVATRRQSGMGGLPTSQITGETTRAGTRGRLDIEAGAEARVVERGTLTNADLVDEILAGNAARGAMSPARKELRKKIKARGREVDTSVYPEELQAWLLFKLDNLLGRVQKTGAKDSRLIDNLADPDAADAAAARLMKAAPGIKSMSDARMLVQLGPDAVMELRKKPLRRYYIDERMQTTKEIFRGEGTLGGFIRRDPDTGVPVDATGKPVAERSAERGLFDEKGQRIIDKDTGKPADLPRDLETGDWRLLTTDGKNFTGRTGQKYASQSVGGSQELASIGVARSGIGSIVEGITSKQIKATVEETRLLTNVMESLGIKVAENATPAQVLKTFKEKAPARFEEVIKNIESAAKDEAVALQLRTVFPVAIKDNISVMEAISRIDPGELQDRAVQWTVQALDTVDETCSVAAGQPNIFLQMMRGLD
jgi:hypothetical protein